MQGLAAVDTAKLWIREVDGNVCPASSDGVLWRLVVMVLTDKAKTFGGPFGWVAREYGHCGLTRRQMVCR